MHAGSTVQKSQTTLPQDLTPIPFISHSRTNPKYAPMALHTALRNCFHSAIRVPETRMYEGD